MSVAVAASMLVIAVYCAARLVISAAAGVPTNVLVDVAHLVMGVGMAGMSCIPAMSCPAEPAAVLGVTMSSIATLPTTR